MKLAKLLFGASALTLLAPLLSLLVCTVAFAMAINVAMCTMVGLTTAEDVVSERMHKYSKALFALLE